MNSRQSAVFKRDIAPVVGRGLAPVEGDLALVVENLVLEAENNNFMLIYLSIFI